MNSRRQRQSLRLGRTIALALGGVTIAALVNTPVVAARPSSPRVAASDTTVGPRAPLDVVDRRPASLPTVGERLAQGLAPALSASSGVDVRTLRRIGADPSAVVTPDGQIAFIDSAPEATTAPGGLRSAATGGYPTGPAIPAPAASSAPEGPRPPVAGSQEVVTSLAARAATGPEFELASRPGSKHTLYIDFRGVRVTNPESWGGDNPVNIEGGKAPFDVDGDVRNFSPLERAMIRSVWEVVSEDYAPVDVNVTTRDPGRDALLRRDATDERYGTRVIVSSTPVTANPDILGIALLGSFDWAGTALSSHMAFVWPREDCTARCIGSVVSHEAGHTLGLVHQSNSQTAYAPAQGIWATIMGDWNAPLAQFSDSDFRDATAGQDDFAVMATHGATLLPDDVGGTARSATKVNLDDGPAEGLVAQRDDVDVYRVRASGQRLRLTASPAASVPNLDLRVRLLDSAGRQVADSNPRSGFDPTVGPSRWAPALAVGLGASIDVATTRGATYFIEVSPVGQGDPTVDGYSTYGSRGRYTLRLGGPVLTVETTGKGRVVATNGSSRPLFACSSSCSGPVGFGTTVRLTAVPGPGQGVAQWVGACAQPEDFLTSTSCDVPMDQVRTVRVVFAPLHTLTTTTNGLVFDVTSGDNIACGPDFAATVCTWRTAAPRVRLFAGFDRPKAFDHWEGCHSTLMYDGQPQCTVTLTVNTTVGAVYVPGSLLTVHLPVGGYLYGESARGALIMCGSDVNIPTCYEYFNPDDTVYLVAYGLPFQSWSDPACGTNTYCAVSMSQDHDLTVNFAQG